MTPATFWLGRITGLLFLIALALISWWLFGETASPARRSIREYVTRLDRQLRFVRAAVRGIHLFFFQVALCMASFGYTLCTNQWLSFLALPAILVGPNVFIAKSVARRVARVEDQIEPWMNAIANALKASPSLGEAIGSTTSLVAAPLSEELDVLVKEYDLGTPLDQALENLGSRITSKTLAGTITALKIARRSGGNLTEMLETAASSLREFARLEGVVRTKTAEGKAQAFVIGMIPIPMVLGISSLDPHFLDPLFHSFVGQLIIAGAVALWAIAILAARKILDVDV